MTCYTPLRGFRSLVGLTKNGKRPIVFKPHGKVDLSSGQDIPCGRCIGCRLERSRQWAIRIMKEKDYHHESSFLTLTYRDDDVIYGGAGGATLYPRHLETFWKRFRKRILKDYGKHIRYFACGEYGDTTHRPHYHAIVFGFYPKDPVLYSSQMGNALYSSEYLDSIWGLGDVRVGDVTFESAAYVARYILGKHLGNDADYYEKNGIEPEFVRMSRGSKKLGTKGLGYQFLKDYFNDVYNHDHVVIRGLAVRPPRYYDKQLEKINPELLAELKIKREIQSELNDEHTTPERLRVRKRVKLAQIRSLKRKLS